MLCWKALVDVVTTKTNTARKKATSTVARRQIREIKKGDRTKTGGIADFARIATV